MPDPRAAVSDLNRSRAWGRHGCCHLLLEVVPFRAIAFLGLAFSTWAADFGITMASRGADSHGVTTAIVMASSRINRRDSSADHGSPTSTIVVSLASSSHMRVM